MRPTPDKQKSVCPTGWECRAVHAPGVKVTTEPPRRDGASAVITGSWKTTLGEGLGGAPPSGARLGANDPSLYCHDCAPSSGDGLATAQIVGGEHSGRARRSAIIVDEGQRSVDVRTPFCDREPTERRDQVSSPDGEQLLA